MSDYQLEEREWPSGMTDAHRALLRGAIRACRQLSQVYALLARGSFARDRMDRFSDLDLALVTQSAFQADLTRSLPEVGHSMGTLVTSFTGEHVGQPDLLICLFAPLAVNVDLKVVTTDDASGCQERSTFVWHRHGYHEPQAVPADSTPFPPDLQWMEDRFWHWVNYAATRVARGEAFEAAHTLDILRTRVLGPLIQAEAGNDAFGVKGLERVSPARAEQLRSTMCSCQGRELNAAIQCAVDMYRSLRDAAQGRIVRRSEAEALALNRLRFLSA